MKVVRRGLDGVPDGARFDLVVVGAGGAGLSTALFAAIAGARVLIVERTAWVGGTTAWSAGTTWIPGTHHAARVNPADSLEQARRYLDHAVGDRAPASLRQAFLDHGRAAVDMVERHSHLRFRPYPKHPDYLSELPGSCLAGRALEPMPFDGRLLGNLFALVRPPIPEFTVLGGMMVDRTDIGHLLGMRRSLASLRHSLALLARHAVDRISHPRGTRLVMGNALIGRLLHSLAQHERVTLVMQAEVESIEPMPAALAPGHRLMLQQSGRRQRIEAGAGLVLASGGFNRDPALRAQRLPGVPDDWSPVAPGATGRMQALVRALGAQDGQGALSDAFWAPVSLRRRADGSLAVFPHFVMDRAKPGVIAVNQRGERFLNESTSYHLFGLAMQAAQRHTPSIPAYLVCDARALRAYGLGMVRPGGRGLAPFLADGYLTVGSTVEALAERLGIDAAGLRASVESMNRHAREGVDPDFHRGETAYQRNLGDPAWAGPNPSLGALDEPPFYAVRLYPGDIGAATGLATNEHAQVLGSQGLPIAGLYAVGNDMQSIMGGVYPAPGITVGPGLVFAYIAARHALSARASDSP